MITLKATKDVNIRSYSEGDEFKIVELFNKIYEEYAGFVPRKIDYWLWQCKSRPDVDSKGILIAENDNKMLGYAVVAKSGDVLEFCYDPRSKDAEKIVRVLLDRTTEYVAESGGDSVKIHAPAKDTLIDKVCKNLGFSKSKFQSFFISVLDFPELIQEILNSRSPETLFKDELFLIELIDAPCWSQSRIRLQFENSNFSAKVVNVEDPDVRIQMPTITFTELIFGRRKPFLELLRRRIKVKPFWKFFKVLKLFSILHLESLQFAPLGDL